MKIIRNGETCPFCGLSDFRKFSVQTNDLTIGPRQVNVIECRNCMSAWQWPEGFDETDTKEYYQTQNSTAEFCVRLLKRPHRLRDYLRMYGDLKTSARRRPHLTNIGIFALAARKQRQSQDRLNFR